MLGNAASPRQLSCQSLLKIPCLLFMSSLRFDRGAKPDSCGCKPQWAAYVRCSAEAEEKQTPELRADKASEIVGILCFVVRNSYSDSAEKSSNRKVNA